MRHPSKPSRSLFLILATIFLLFGSLYSFSEYNTTKSKNYAISGYDTVAYFTEEKPVKGVEEHQHEWMGATWLFSSATHLEMFKAAPEKYAPQYGGYCAWAIATKKKLFNISPNVWKIVEGKLYLNYNAKIGKRWEKKMDDLIEKADVNWEKMVAKEKKES